MAQPRTELDVPAVSTPAKDLLVDVFHPGDNANGACLLFLPGGGFRVANKAGLHERYAARIAARGYVFIATEYRVADDGPWPGPMQDAKALIRWARANAQRLGFDPERIVLGGASAGGQLALLCAASQGDPAYEGVGGNEEVSSHIAAVIGVYPVTDITNRPYDEHREKLYGKDPDAAMLRNESPLHRVTAAYPPTMLVHGTGDTVVSHRTTLQMFDALEDAGVPVDLHLFAGQEHIFDREPHFADVVSSAMALFMERYAPALTPAAG